MDSEKSFNGSGLNIDTENVKTKLQEFFKYPNLIGELYKTLSISDTDLLNSLERLSHYCTVKKLFEAIPNIDKFASSSKKLKSCFKGNIDDMYFLYMALLPSIFSSFKELYMGKTSRQDGLNRLNNEDLQELDDIITIPNNLSSRQKISEIRNALNHGHYVTGKDNLYIKNPKNVNPKIHARNFEAKVPYRFLIDFIVLTQIYYRRTDYSEFYIDDQELFNNLWKNKRDIRYEDVKDKIHYFYSLTKDKYGDDSEDSAKEEVRKEVVLSEQLENLILKYFANHNLDIKNLRYIAESLIKAPEIHMWEILSAIISNETFGSNRYKGLNSTELLDDVYRTMIDGSYYGYFNQFDGYDGLDGFDRVKAKEILVNFGKELEKQRQPNGQSILKHYNGCREYAYKYLEKNKFSPHKEGGIEYIEKGNIKIPSIYIQASINQLISHYYIINNMIKLFPNWLRIQLIKLVYVNEQVSLQDEKVDGLISKIDGLISKIDTSEDEQGKGKKTTRERIRDALSHHSYILLEGVDDIILRDGYDKKTDSWAREATFSLSKLFESTFKEINESSISSSSSFLLESLNSLDN